MAIRTREGSVQGLALVLCLGLGMSMSAGVMAAAKPLLQEGKKTLYQRVLTTPGCELGKAPAVKEGKRLPAFTRFYVYQRKNQDNAEWLQVGPDRFGSTSGWLNAACTVDWKLQLTLAFTNPAGRDPLLFFNQRKSLETLFAKEDPTPLIKPIREHMKAQGRDPAVVAQEPVFAVDQQKNFYLLPILEAEEILTEQGFRTRLLKVASVSAPGKPSTDKPAAGKPGPEAGKPQPLEQMLKGFSASVVFVIDSTISMGPYIDRTREAIRKVYDKIEQEKLLNQVKFGLVAYRSNVQATPGLEYLSRLYVDPVSVKNGQDFLARVAELKPARVSSSSFDEDAFAGVMLALDKVQWNEFGARYLVLITDAGALAGDDKLSSTGLNAGQVRLEAQYRGVAIYTMHLKTPSGSKNHQSAAAQYTDLSHNPYLNKPLYYPVEAGNVDSFGRMVDSLADAITSQVKAAYRGDMAAGSALGADEKYAKSAPAPASSASKPEKQLQQDAALLGHAMALAYLGEKTGVSAPPVFQAWISDRDFLKQNVPTTEVRVLLTKSELSDLHDVVKEIANAANEGLISPDSLFTRLRSVAATLGRDPARLQQGDAVKLSELGLLDEYLQGLPYPSEVLNLDAQTWKSWTVSQQEQFIRHLNTKLKYYQRYNSDADRWVSLAEGSDPRDHVYPIPLEALP